MGEVGNIWIKIGAKIDDFERNMSAAEKAMVKVGDKFQDIGKTLSIAGAAITASMGLIIAKTANLGDKFYDLSQRTGIAVETLSSFKLAADKSGTSIEGFATGMKGLSRVMFEAASGGKEAKEAFSAVGVSATDDVGKLRPLDQVMLDVADRFASMADGAEKNALAMKLFGKSGMDLIPMLNLGRKGLQENIDKMQKFGAVTLEEARAGNAFNEAMTELQAATGGLTRTIGNALIPVMTDLATKIAGAIAKVKDWAKEHPGLVSGLSKVALGVGAFLSILGPTIIGLATILKNIVPLKAALGLLQGGFAALISPVGLATAGIVALLIAIAPGDTIVEKFGAILEATTQTIKAWIQAVREANEIISGSWFAKSFKMEIAAQMAEAKTKAVEFAASLQVLKPSMDAIQQTMEQGPKVWNEWSTSVKATDAILAANKETIVKWIDQALVWLGLTKDMSGGASVLGDMLKALGLKTKTELTAELANAEAALKLLKSSAEATPGAIKALEDKIKTLKEGITGVTVETRSLAEQLGITFRADTEARIKKLNEALLTYRGKLTYDEIKRIYEEINKLTASMEGLRGPVIDVDAAIRTLIDGLDALPLTGEEVADAVGKEFTDLRVQMQADFEKLAYDDLPESLKNIPTVAKAVTKETHDYFAGMLNDIARGFGDAISQWCQGLTTFKDFAAGIWGNIKDAFFRVIGQMIAEWTVKFITQALIELGILKAAVTAATGEMAVAASASFATMAAAAGAFLATLTAIVLALTVVLSLLDTFFGPDVEGNQPDAGYGSRGRQVRERPGRHNPGYAAGGIAWVPQLARVAEREPEIIMPLRKFRGAQTPADAGKYPQGGGPSGPVNLTFNIKALDGADMINVVHNKIKPILQNRLNHNGLRVPTGAIGGA